MQDMVFHLSFLLDSVGYNRIDLINSNSLRELDNFIMKNFKSSQDVRERYSEEISEFCLNNMNFIQKENKRNQRNWTGSIVIIAERHNDKVNYFHKIKVMYHNSLKLLTFKETIKKIKNKMHDKKILNEMRTKKAFLFSENEKDLLRKNDKEYSDYFLNMAIDFFINRLKKNDEWSYYCRRTLTNLCELDQKEIALSKGKLKITDLEVSNNYVLKHAPSSVHFEETLNKKDNEELFNFYDLDEIILNSDSYDKNRKGKR